MGDPFDPFSRVRHVLVANDANWTGAEAIDVCSQLCFAEDILARNIKLPPLRSRDLLTFLDVGAYNDSFANQSNATLRSATVLVSGDREALVHVVKL